MSMAMGTEISMDELRRISDASGIDIRLLEEVAYPKIVAEMPFDFIIKHKKYKKVKYRSDPWFDRFLK